MKSRMKQVLLGGTIVLIIAVLVHLRATRIKQMNAEPTIPVAALPVFTSPVRFGAVAVSNDEFGVLAANTESTVAPQIMARCIAVYKREGDSVRSGEILARLDSQELQQAADASNNQYLAGMASAAAVRSGVQQAREDYSARLSDVEAAKSAVAAQAAEVAVAQQNVASSQAQVEALRASIAAARVAAAAQDARTSRDKILYANQAISLEQYQASETAQSQSQAAVAALASQIDAAQAGVGAARQRVNALNEGVDGAKQKLAAVKATAMLSRLRIGSQHSTALAARAQARAMERTAATARTRVNYSVLRAPYAGVITARMAEPGDLVAPGQPVYRMLKPGSIKVIATVPQELAVALRTGLPVTLSAVGQHETAAISRLYPALTSSHMLTVEVDLPTLPFGLKSGSTLMVSLQVRSKTGLIVPSSAILAGSGVDSVYRVRSNRLEVLHVKRIISNGDETVVDGPIKPGDELVVGTQSQLMALYSDEPVLVSNSGGTNETH